MGRYTINDQFLTPDKIADITGSSADAVRRDMHAGGIPHLRIGRRMLCPVTAFEDYINAQVERVKTADE